MFTQQAYVKPAFNSDSFLNYVVTDNIAMVLKKLIQDRIDPNTTDPQTGDTALSLAVANLNVPMVKLLLDWDANPNIFNKNDRNAFYYALLLDNAEIIMLLKKHSHLLAYRADPNAFSPHSNKSLLSIAINNNDPVMVKALLAHKANPLIGDRDKYQTLPHISAARIGNIAILEALFTNKDFPIDINKPNPVYGLRALEIALGCHHIELVEALLRHGANPNLRSIYNNQLPMQLACEMNLYRIAELFLTNPYHPDNRVDANIKTRNGDTLLYDAIENNNRRLVQLLLDNKANLDDVAPQRARLTRIAVYNNNFTLAKLLLEKHSDPNLDLKQDGLLTYAIKYNNLAMVNLLLEHKVNPNLADDDEDKTLPYFIAARLGRIDILEALIRNQQHPLDINKTNEITGNTALIEAVTINAIDSVKALLRLGADPNVANPNTGMVALIHSINKAQIELMQLLLTNPTHPELCANPNYLDQRNDVWPLKIALTKQNAAMIDLLLSHRADVNYSRASLNYTALTSIFTDHSFNLSILKTLIQHPTNPADINQAAPTTRKTALLLAIQAGYLEVVKFLLMQGAKMDYIDVETGLPCILFAAAKGQADIFEYLLTLSPKDEFSSDQWSQTLHAAINTNADDVIKILLQRGIDPQHPHPITERTALIHAIEQNKLSAVKQLIKYKACIDFPEPKYPLEIPQPFCVAMHLSRSDILETLLHAKGFEEIPSLILQKISSVHLSTMVLLILAGAKIAYPNLLTQALNNLPPNITDHYRLNKYFCKGVIAQQTQQRYSALRFFKIVLNLANDMHVAHLHIGETYLHLGCYYDAFTHFAAAAMPTNRLMARRLIDNIQYIRENCPTEISVFRSYHNFIAAFFRLMSKVIEAINLTLAQWEVVATLANEHHDLLPDPYLGLQIATRFQQETALTISERSQELPYLMQANDKPEKKYEARSDEDKTIADILDIGLHQRALKIFTNINNQYKQQENHAHVATESISTARFLLFANHLLPNSQTLPANIIEGYLAEPSPEDEDDVTDGHRLSL